MKLGKFMFAYANAQWNLLPFSVAVSIHLKVTGESWGGVAFS